MKKSNLIIILAVLATCKTISHYLSLNGLPMMIAKFQHLPNEELVENALSAAAWMDIIVILIAFVLATQVPMPKKKTRAAHRGNRKPFTVFSSWRWP